MACGGNTAAWRKFQTDDAYQTSLCYGSLLLEWHSLATLPTEVGPTTPLSEVKRRKSDFVGLSPATLTPAASTGADATNACLSKAYCG